MTPSVTKDLVWHFKNKGPLKKTSVYLIKITSTTLKRIKELQFQSYPTASPKVLRNCKSKLLASDNFHPTSFTKKEDLNQCPTIHLERLCQ